MTRRWMSVLAIVGVATTGLVSPASASATIDRFTLKSGARLPYYHNHSLEGAAHATQAVVVVHGTGRNARGYFDSVVKSAEHAGVRDTVIIAPRFQTAEDKPASGDAFWTNGDATSWKDGGDSVSRGAVSSFAAMDEVLARLADRTRFPKLTRVTLVGHSAGGQFVQRYAAGGRVTMQPGGATFHFVTANPSSYLYFTADRPVRGGVASCPKYDDYKYGLKRLNRYMGELPAGRLVEQYTGREVTYLLGGDDIHQNHSIDDSCSAKAQGRHRLERGRNYFAHIRKSSPAARHDMVVVPGIGHDHEALFDSSQGRTAIFGT
ncbi:hypothetical protein [Allokutzneria oryzae]|uniref:Alpha/beta hydrolase n=1 Tax=Allokutzneria oryzae TaxID=1378989 RepID=A0ABV5ZTD5_9PSEU